RAGRIARFNVAAQPASASSDVIEASLCMSHGIEPARVAKWFGERTVDQATGQQYRGLGLHALMRMTMQAFGMTPPIGRFTDSSIKAALQADAQLSIRAGEWGPSTYGGSGMSSLLSNLANKLLLSSYEGTGVTWSKWCRVGDDVTDFKVWTRYRVT